MEPMEGTDCLLAACMHGGWSIVGSGCGGQKTPAATKILHCLDLGLGGGDGELVYAATATKIRDGSNEFAVAACTFYGRELREYRVRMPMDV